MATKEITNSADIIDSRDVIERLRELERWNNSSWPCNCIDWEQAAEQLKQDYTTVEFGDETYYARS